jgi:hypothetical protein
MKFFLKAVCSVVCLVICEFSGGLGSLFFGLGALLIWID